MAKGTKELKGSTPYSEQFDQSPERREGGKGKS